MTVIERAKAFLLRTHRPEGTPGQTDQERETAASLGLMAQAASAGADMTDEQAIFLSSSKAGMNARIAHLRGPDVPKPLSLAQERELTMIERELARMEGRGAPQAPPAPVRRFLPALPAVAANPLLALALSPWTWLVAVSAFALIQMGLKERIEDQRDEARAEAARMEQSRNAYAAELGRERAQRARDVAEVLEQTAETVEQMRRQEARRIARQRREESRREDLANGNVNFTERLRELAQPDPGLPADPAAAPGSGPAGSVSTEPRSDASDGANP